MRAGHLDVVCLEAPLARADRVRGVVRARACARLLNPLSQSRPESLMRYWPGTSDLPDPQPQIPVLDQWGRDVAHGGLGYSRWKVPHEDEGRHHADLEQLRRDVGRRLARAALRRSAPHRTGHDRRADARCPAQPGSACWAGLIIGSLPRTRHGAPESRATSR
jgi:hypothetical protein